MKKKKKSNENKKWLIITIIYFVLVLLFSFIFHEKWRDEAQAFLLARDLDLVGLFKQLSCEGHPPVWYLLIMPFAKLGFPYEIENVISCLFMAVGNYLILTKSPFKDWKKVLIILLAPSFAYAVVSRSYCLIPLALYLIAIIYKDRHKDKMKYVFSLLFLLYTHILMLGLVAALFIQFGIEELILINKNIKEIKSFFKVFLISCFFVLLLVLILRGGTNENILLKIGLSSSITIKDFFATLVRHLFFVNFFIYLLVILFLVYILYSGLKNNIKELLVLIAGIVWQLFIYLYLYSGNFQKISLLLYMFIFYCWISFNNKKNNKIINIIIFILLINNIVVGYSVMRKDYLGNFSNAKVTAEFIEKNTKENSVFVPTDTFVASSLIPYTKNKKFWSAASKEYYTYVVQNKDYVYDYSGEEMLEIINNNFDNTDSLYLIVTPYSNVFLTKEKLDTYEELEKEGLLIKIYSDKDKPFMKDEYYVIYKINKGV